MYKTEAMRLQYSSPKEILPKYFSYYLNNLKTYVLLSITGGTRLKSGCGKSYAALRIGELIDEDFDIENVCFTPREFLEAIDRIEESGKKRRVVIMDEGEITAPSNLWYSVTNTAIFYTMVTFRYLRSMAIIVTPSLRWIDSRLRTMLTHFAVSNVQLEHAKRKYSLILKEVVTDLFGEKTFFRSIRMFNTQTQTVDVIKKIYITKPSEEIVNKYEEKVAKFKQGIRAEFLEKIKHFEKYTHAKATNIDNLQLQELVNIVLNNEFVKEEITEKNKVSTDAIKFALQSYDLTQKQIAMIKYMINSILRKKVK